MLDLRRREFVALEPVCHRLEIEHRRRETVGRVEFRRLGFVDERDVGAGDKAVNRHRYDQRDGEKSGDAFPDFGAPVFPAAAALAQQHAERSFGESGLRHGRDIPAG